MNAPQVATPRVVSNIEFIMLKSRPVTRILFICVPFAIAGIVQGISHGWDTSGGSGCFHVRCHDWGPKNSEVDAGPSARRILPVLIRLLPCLCQRYVERSRHVRGLFDGQALCDNRLHLSRISNCALDACTHRDWRVIAYGKACPVRRRGRRDAGSSHEALTRISSSTDAANGEVRGGIQC
jgi:hypothetical protein